LILQISISLPSKHLPHKSASQISDCDKPKRKKSDFVHATISLERRVTQIFCFKASNEVKATTFTILL
jgi:hypothetical protein